MDVILYKNSSATDHINKKITLRATVSCDFKKPVDVVRPVIYISATNDYDDVNYVYIPEFNRFYYATCTGGTSQTLTYECKSDPLMSFKTGILSSKAVVARNPWLWDKYLPDTKMPIESRTIRSTYKFPNPDIFKGTNNSFILTTLGSGSSD